MSASSIEDRLAVEDLFTRYATSLDAGDVEGVVGCFTEDGELLGTQIVQSRDDGPPRGHDVIREFATRYARYRAAGNQLRHALSNMAVRLEGDRATVTCYLVTVATQQGKTDVAVPGRYVCTAVKRDGEWRFQSRRVSMDSAVRLVGI